MFDTNLNTDCGEAYWLWGSEGGFILRLLLYLKLLPKDRVIKSLCAPDGYNTILASILGSIRVLGSDRQGQGVLAHTKAICYP
jgi:hypothetical protein